MGKTIGVTGLRGQWRTCGGIPLMPTCHPAYLLRNQGLSEKRRVPGTGLVEVGFTLWAFSP